MQGKRFLPFEVHIKPRPVRAWVFYPTLLRSPSRQGEGWSQPCIRFGWDTIGGYGVDSCLPLRVPL